MSTASKSGSCLGGRYALQVVANRINSRVPHEPNVCSCEPPSFGFFVFDLVAAACNDAARRATEAAQQKMSGLMGGMPLPPGMKMPF